MNVKRYTWEDILRMFNANKLFVSILKQKTTDQIQFAVGTEEVELYEGTYSVSGNIVTVLWYPEYSMWIAKKGDFTEIVRSRHLEKVVDSVIEFYNTNK